MSDPNIEDVKKEKSTRAAGAKMEEKAAAFLTRHGVRILAKNYRVRQAEIDIVGIHEGTLVFFEVKARRGRANGMASEAVGDAKQKKICRCADHYMLQHNIDRDTMPIRFDVVTIGPEEERRERELGTKAYRTRESAGAAGGPCGTREGAGEAGPYNPGRFGDAATPPNQPGSFVLRSPGKPAFAYKTPAEETIVRDPNENIRWIIGAFPYRRGKPSVPHWRVY